MPSPWSPVRQWPIRHKLQLAFLGLFLAMALAQGAASRWILGNVIQHQVEKELDNATTSLENLVKTAVDTSIQSYLRGIAEKNLELIVHLHTQVLEGRITEAMAKRRAMEILLAQRIGTTGYIYVVGSSGHILVHPLRELRGADLTRHAFIREQIKRREGYLEYQWANPGDRNTRPKAIYMTYFGPWDWIVSVSSYRDEFRELVNINDFRDRILSVRFGETGYPFVIDTQGALVVHPAQEGRNILESQDSSGRYFIKELIQRRNGRIVYPWKNPGEQEAREKLVIFRYLPEMDWILASCSYLEEFQRASRLLAWATGSGFLFLALLSAICTYWISRTITQPLGELTQRVAASGGAMLPNTRDEVAVLAGAFNRYISDMETGRRRLFESESRYRGLFENAVEGIFQSTPDGRFLTTNPSLARLLGYESPDQLVSSIQDIPRQLYADPAQRAALWKVLETQKAVHGFEVEFLRRDGSRIWVAIHARAVLEEGRIAFMEGFLTEVSSERQVRETLLQTQRELEDRVEHRTIELRSWVKQLERRNFEIAELQEMSEMLAICESIPESFPIIEGSLTKLFEGFEGQFHLAMETDYLTGVARIGSGPASLGIYPSECWGMRANKLYYFAPHTGRPSCPHLGDDFRGESLCVPITASGEIQGLLHLRRNQDDETGAEMRTLAPRVAEHLALALANLKLRETLRDNSIRDALTGVYNRRYLEEFVTRELQRASRQGLPVGFALLDIDHFKLCNDKFGHDMGDTVLRRLVRQMSAQLRDSDLMFRFGGEEFLVVLPGADARITLDRAESLREDVARNLHLDHPKGRHSVTISAGVSAFPDFGTTLEQLIKVADAALYTAKKTGRNRVVLADRATRPQGEPSE